VQGDGRGGFRTSAGDISSVVPLGLGEPLAPYATVDFTVALNEQTTKKERPPVGVTIPKPEPDMELEEDAQAGLSVVAMGTTAADDLGVCRLEYEASRFHDWGISIGSSEPRLSSALSHHFGARCPLISSAVTIVTFAVLH
jgi:hypothetical protein